MEALVLPVKWCIYAKKAQALISILMFCFFFQCKKTEKKLVSPKITIPFPFVCFFFAWNEL